MPPSHLPCKHLSTHPRQRDLKTSPFADDGCKLSGGNPGFPKAALEAKYGTSPEAKTKALQDTEFMMTHMDLDLVMKCGRALGFLRDLQPENDSHYVGKGVKLDTPDRPIFWYKPSGRAIGSS